MTVFTVFKDKDHLEFSVYESIEDLTKRMEWQDTLGDYFTIIDRLGNVYKWDESKTDEYATVYDYTLKIYRQDLELARICVSNFEINNNADEFIVSINPKTD